uniref:AlNc14C156G7644 protein n=1 Tax=Albugo laibachii Nc14 TaxID=890382 RepID=F0WME7_9STRA|nr:AlNc14C156G7644 [Albugo laibachii Nc14]|eukprot:CCA22479.1 AlNc14C156G7644 [Albugo laibachii Nc14]
MCSFKRVSKILEELIHRHGALKCSAVFGCICVRGRSRWFARLYLARNITASKHKVPRPDYNKKLSVALLVQEGHILIGGKHTRLQT